MLPDIKLKIAWSSIKGENWFVYYKAPSPSSQERISSFLQHQTCKPINDLIELFRKKEFLDYSLLIYNKKQVYAKMDVVASQPLFYNTTDNTICVSDSFTFQTKINSNTAIKEFIGSGFIYGPRTLSGNMKRMQAGEELSFASGRLKCNQLFTYQYQNTLKGIQGDDFQKEFKRRLSALFLRHLDFDTRLVVPLSGGHDSRLIVNYLYKLGFKNVICYSYGTKGNIQSKLSQQVAEALGYPWFFIEYSEEKWQRLHEADLIKNYIMYSFNGGSTPHLQDFLAINELKAEGVIEAGNIVIPGHTLDFLTGGHVNQEDFDCKSPEESCERTLRRHLPKYLHKKKLLIDVKKHVSAIYSKAKVHPENFQEYFNWQERQSKFIVNSIRTYDFFKLQTFLPFWQSDIVKLWLTVPPELKTGREWYYSWEKNLYVSELKDIPFEDGSKSKEKQNQGIGLIAKKQVTKLVPTVWQVRLLRLINRKQILNEGMNQIYALQASSLKELIHPLEEYSNEITDLFRSDLERYPYQLEAHNVTRLYTLKLIITENKSVR